MKDTTLARALMNRIKRYSLQEEMPKYSFGGILKDLEFLGSNHNRKYYYINANNVLTKILAKTLASIYSPDTEKEQKELAAVELAQYQTMFLKIINSLFTKAVEENPKELHF